FAFAFIFEGNIGLGAIWASILLHTIFAVLMIVLFVKSRRKLWEKILVGNYIEIGNEKI
ncbi:hypothetical protein LCGC14_2944040, partial [marine sediment metagenome]